MSENLSPLKQAFLAIEELQAKLEAAEQSNKAASTPIAVIGLGCRLPGGANDPETFWNNLKNGVDGICDVPADRWDSEAFYDADPDAPGKSYVRQSGFIDGVDQFDPQFFGIAPREAHSMDPQQRIVLEVAWEALEHAGINPGGLGGSRTGVFLGIASADYANLFIKTNDPTALDTYYSSGIAHSIASGRISYVLGLQGPSVSVDTACSSSLVATHLAVQSLRTGDSDLALAGGVNLILLPDNQISFSRLRMLSADGRCHTFDAKADGFGDGEGCGVVVLKRLPDALRDGDRVLAVIRGSAANQDGASSGLTAPNGPSQEAVIRAALANGGIQPAEVGYIEAHGTGTSLGDPIEVRALGAVLSQGRPAGRPFYLGSVKTNVGHLEAGAGITALIKTVLALQHGEIPPHLNFSTPNPLIAWDEIPTVVNTELAPWPEGYERRIAGVSAFGFSGTNVHLVLEAAPQLEDPQPAAQERPQHLLTLSARNDAALRDMATRYRQFLREQPVVPLADFAHTANVGRAKLAARLAVVARDSEQAAQRLDDFLAGEDTPSLIHGVHEGGDPPKIAFLFTGQGAQYVGMGRQLYETQPVFRAALDRCDAILRAHLGESLLAILYPPDGDEAAGKIDQTAITQPALFAIEWALAQVWMSWGVTPAAVMGHSLGEYVAAVLAGVFSLEDGLKLIAARGRLMGALPEGGAMAAVFAPAEAVQQAIAGQPRVSIAAVNGLDSTVVSGDREAVQAVQDAFAQQGIKFKPLNVSHAFHSPRMDPMLDEFERIAAEITYASPKIRFISDVSGEFARGAQIANPRYWRDHVRQPVQFLGSIQTLYREGFDVFVEIGPNPTLSGMGQRILADPGRPLTWATSLKQNQDDWAQILTGLGRVFAAGGSVDWAAFDQPYPRRKLALPTYPFQRSRYWVKFETPQAGAPRSAARAVRAVHPLLGERLRSPSSTVTFQNWLDSAAFSFLNDHRIEGSAILPGTAFIETALAAAKLYFQDEPRLVEDLTIHTALIVPDGEEHLLQVVLTPGDDGSVQMEVYTQAGEKDPWLRHASAVLRAQPAGSPTAVEALETIQSRCDQHRERDEHYQQLMDSGLTFGDGLKGVQEIWRRDGEALGRIAPTAAVVAESGYLIHPSLLDAHLQMMASALPAGQNIYLPLHFEKIERYNAAAPVWSHVHISGGAGGETVHADLTLLDESGQPVMALHGITLKRADRASLHQPGKDPYANWLYQVAWHPAALEAAPQASIISPSRLATQLDPTLARLYRENGLDEYLNDVLPDFDRLSSMYINNALLKLGWRPAVGQRFTAIELAEQLKIIPQHRRLIGYLLRILQEDRILRAGEDGSWEVLRVPQAEDAKALYTSLLKVFPQYEGELEVTGRCGAALAECLNGTADPLQLIFPGGSLDTAEKIYQKSPAALTYNGLMREVVAAIQALTAAPKQPGQKLRVLEIGAGTGGTTSFVVPLLPADDTEYTFTDISPLFPAKAKQKFSQYGFMRYQVLDIEKDPAGQGLEGQQFDLILAANVIHATQDLRTTLRHVRQLLAPGGQFVMLEVTAPQRWVDITFGLTDGWWRFVDKDLRPDYPLLSRARWIALLQSAGFAEADTVPQIGGEVERSVLEEAVVIARAPAASDALGAGWLITGGVQAEAELAAGLAARLGNAMVLDDTALAELPKRIGAAGALRGVIFLGETADVLAAPETGQVRGDLRSLLAVSQALVSGTFDAPPRLWVVTRAAQAAVEGDIPDPAQAGLWGFAKGAAMEHPELSWTRIDLDGDEPNPVEAVLVELAQPENAPGREEEIARRGGQRLAARLEHHSLPSGEAEPKALTLAQPGALDTLHWHPMRRRKPGPGEVEIRVQASGLNFKDLMIALGMVPGADTPLGGECAGVVSAVGEGVTHLHPGDPVMAVATGSFGSHAMAPAAFAARIPANLSVAQAASNLIPYITASYALNHIGGMKAGDRVLIHSGAGGVGLAAIQLAQRAGAEIFATAGSPEKRTYLQSLSVPHVMDSRSLDFAAKVRDITSGRGVDLLLNSLAGDFIPAGLGITAQGGHFLEIGKSGLLTDQEAAERCPGIHYHVIDWTEQALSQPELISAILNEIVSGLASGALRPLPVKTFPASDVVNAFRYMQAARHTGKIVIQQTADISLPIVRSDAAYLVTGGLRGLGLLTAKWLVEQGACAVALLGRSAPAAETQEELRKLEARGVKVLVLQGDVSVEADVRRALEQIARELPPLRGIIHSAGRLDDAALTNQTWARFENVLGPKITGAALLDTCSAHLPLDFFVAYSSIASVFGSQGQSNHTAANASMDALIHERRARGLPGLSINWGVWAEVGIAAGMGQVERGAEQGIESIHPQDGMKILDRLMRSPAVQVVVNPVNWPVFLKRYSENVPPLLRSLAAESARAATRAAAHQTEAARPAAPAQPEFLRQLAETPADRKPVVLLNFVQKQAAKVLGLETSAVGEHTPLNEMGLDSLMAVELRNLLGKALDLKRPLPVTMVFDYPTITAIRDYLARDVLNLQTETPAASSTLTEKTAVDGKSAMLESIEDLSDDDVDRLLAEMNKGKK